MYTDTAEIKMRKFKREIKDFDDIIDVLNRCDTLRLGISGDEYPYVVPLSFGFEVVDGSTVIYIHGAKEGFKHELLSKNNKVCVEADIFHRYIGCGCAITAIFESVIGFGVAEIADKKDSAKGLELIMEHCGQKGFSASVCPETDMTLVYKITLSSITGKRRLADD